jgi:ATP-GRASP peptide maturase of grasp-with-spasm system
MVLIISITRDISTHDVVDWFIRNKVEYFLIHQHDRIEKIKMQLSTKGAELDLVVEGRPLNLKNITSFWYRRGHLLPMVVNKIMEQTHGNAFKSHLSAEWNSLADFIHRLFESKRSIGAYRKEQYNNKLNNLMVAAQCGLCIPETYVISNKLEASALIESQRTITKSLNNDILFDDKKRIFFTNFGPMLLKQPHLKKMKENFWPSLLQPYVSKQYELRIFILHEKIFAAAIFSQSNESSRIDSRISDSDKPERMVPYRLPDTIQSRLLDFMRLTGLDTASIDMIYTKSNEYIFLEANPVGQYGYVSAKCNFHLDHEVSSYLSLNKCELT